MTTTPLPVWRTQLDSALAAAPIHKDFCMATAAAHGNTPRVRLVTHQGFSPSNLLLVATDRTSDKVGDLQAHPECEIAWFLPPRQFRIRGQAVVIGEANEWPAAARRLGIPRSAEDGTYAYWRREKERIFGSLGPLAAKYDHAPPRGAHVPPGTDNAHFNLVMIAVVPTRVEVLDLVGVGYTTYVSTDKGWMEEDEAIRLRERAHI